jgi:flagellar basal-body rod protein FlgB
MEPVFLLNLASRKTAWLAARQATIAANIANQNTPGYQARDVAPFQAVLAHTRLDMTTTNSAHLTTSGTAGDVGTPTEKEQIDDFDVTESGNSVGMEGEMAKGSEVNREYALTTNLVKTFHSMLMAALKE